MKKLLSAIFIQPVTIVIICALLVLGGVMGALGMPMQLIPDLRIPIVSVVVTYPGASASAVEENVTSVISDALGNIGGVTQCYSYSYDNLGAVMLEFDFGVDTDEKTADVRERASALSLPEGCSAPEVSALDLNGQATATLYVTSELDSLSDVSNAAAAASDLAASLSAIDGVDSVQTDGAPTHTVTVTPVSGLESTVLLITEALGGGEYDIPLGSMQTENGSVQVRNLSDVASTGDIRALPVELPASVMDALGSANELLTTFEGENAAAMLTMLDGMTAESSPAKPLIAELIAFKTANPAALTDEQACELVGIIAAYDKSVLSSVPVIGSQLAELSGMEIRPGLMAAIRAYGSSVTGTDGVLVTIGDIADVIGPGDAGYMPEYDAYAFYDGKQGVKLSVFAAQDANAADVVSAVKEKIAGAGGDGLTVVLTDDRSEFINDSVGNVLVSMLIGGVIAVLVIFLFLKKVKPSLIISVTMPLSVLAALLLLFVMGITLNMVSLGGLAVGIGMLVDNSIVVIEAITKRREAGDRPFRAAVNGTAEVAGALVGSTLTTVCVFIPILFVGGLCAEIFTDLAWAVIWSLAFSLLVALTVIPTLYALFSPDRKLLTGSALAARAALGGSDTSPEMRAEELGGVRSVAEERNGEKAAAATADEMTAESGAAEGKKARAEDKGEKGRAAGKKRRSHDRIMTATANFYGRLIPAALRHKAVIILIMAALFIASVGLALTAGTEFLPSVDRGQIQVDLTYDAGTTLDEAQSDAELLSGRLKELDGVDGVSVSVGVQGLLAFDNTGVISITTSGNTTELTQTVRELVRSVRGEGLMPYTATAAVSEIDGIVESLTGGMSDISVTVRGEDPSKLSEISGIVTEITSGEEYTSAGFENVSAGETDSLVTEYEVHFDRNKLAEAGIDYATAVLTLRVGLAGQTAATATVDGVDAQVNVSFADGAPAGKEDLENFTLSVTADGERVTLGSVSTIEETTARTVIRKEDGLYAVTLTAEVYGLDSGTAGKMLENAAKEALSRTDPATGDTYADGGYICVTSGVAEYLSNAFGGLYVALAVSFFLLFGVMAAQFRSVVKPLIIMCAVPFSFTGAFVALAITGMTLNVVSLVGIIMLMGVIVNNAIVMLEKIAQLHAEGMTHYDAVVEGCRTRLRPILMTTLTTVLALIPLALGLGSGGELMQPLGITVMGGLIIGTIVTLVLIPCIYCGVHGISAARPDGRKGR